MVYELPKSVDINGKKFEIRSDYRAILDICIALSDSELSDEDRAQVALEIFYPDFPDMDPADYEEALQKCFWFINCGDETQNRKAPQLMSWEQDFKYIVAPVNRVMGREIRSVPYLHWWTFISAYYEIGDCLFAQIIRIRTKKAKGKMDKADRDWYRKNREIVDLKTQYTEKENDLIALWTGQKPSEPR